MARPPNYKPASSAAESCATCAYFASGRSYCEMFNVSVKPEMTCSKWTATRSEVPMNRVEFVRQLVREKGGAEVPMSEDRFYIDGTPAGEEYRRTFSQAERDKYAKEGIALPDGSFPIPDVSSLKDAIQAAGRASDKGKAVAHIKKRAKALGRSDLIPDGWRTAQLALEEPRDEEQPGAEPDADDLAPTGEVDDTLTNECPTCEGVGTLGGVPCPNVEAHLEATESVGGQQQVSEPKTAAWAARERRKLKAELYQGMPERRWWQRSWGVPRMELRKAGENLVEALGTASVVDHPYEVMDFEETLVGGAFKRTLAEKPDVMYLKNHGGEPLARTTTSSLFLQADPNLDYNAHLQLRDPDVQSLLPKLERKDLDESSFAFRARQQEWNKDYTVRRIFDVSIHKGDVSVVNHGANPATTAGLRSLSEQFCELRNGKHLSPETQDEIRETIDRLTGMLDAPQDVVPEPIEIRSKPLHRSNVEWAKGRRAKLRRSQ